MPRAADTADVDSGEVEPDGLSRLVLRPCADPEARGEGGYDATPLGPGWGETEGSSSDQYSGGGLVAADFDGDDVPDLFLPSEGMDQLWMSDGASGWVEEAAERLETAAEAGVGGCGADFDGDGDVDLLALGLGTANRLLFNDGTGRFSEASGPVGTGAYHSVGCTLADVDGDGDLDIAIANHNEGPHLAAGLTGGDFPPAHLNRLFLGDGTGEFEEVSTALPDGFRRGYSFVIGVFDANRDGVDDLYAVNDFGAFVQPNAVALRTDTGWTMAEAPDLELPLFGMGLAMGDLNGDGVEDLLMSSWTELALLESDSASWARTEAARGLGLGSDQQVGWGTALTDLDHDTDLDVVAAFGRLVMPESVAAEIEERHGIGNPLAQPDGIWTQAGDGRFSAVGTDWNAGDTGTGRGFVLADLDGDGWLDLIKRQIGGADRALLARCGTPRSLTVSLDGPGPNPFGVGAWVTIEVGGETQRRRIRAGGSNFASSGPAEAHFGLGAATGVDVLRVDWPDGNSRRWTGVAAGRVRVQP